MHTHFSSSLNKFSEVSLTDATEVLFSVALYLVAFFGWLGVLVGCGKLHEKSVLKGKEDCVLRGDCIMP